METLRDIIQADWKLARMSLKMRTANLGLEGLARLVEGVAEIQPENSNMTDAEHAAWVAEAKAELHANMAKMGHIRG